MKQSITRFKVLKLVPIQLTINKPLANLHVMFSAVARLIYPNTITVQRNNKGITNGIDINPMKNYEQTNIIKSAT